MAKRQSKRSFRAKFLEFGREIGVRAKRLLLGFLRFAACVLALALLIVSMWKLFFSGADVASDDSGAGRPAGERVIPSIVIDAGHGGIDGGTVGNGHVERDITLPIARKLAAALEARGHEIRMTRTADVDMPLKDRSAFANKEVTKVFVSIHVNAGPSSVHGIETFYSSPKALAATAAARASFYVKSGAEFKDSRGEMLAERVQEAVCATTEAKDRGAKNRASLSVTRHTHAPAVLVECGFLSNASEAKRLADSGYQDKLAEGIADGVELYLDAVDQDPYFGVRIGGADPGTALVEHR